ECLWRGMNGTTAAYATERCIHELFEEQVRRSPEAVAVEDEGHALDYRQLNAEANCLAHLLIECGVQPDERVAICVERSVAMVVGLLGILKAGGAYVPLEPDYPSGRLDTVLADAAPRIVLIDAAGRAALGERSLEGVRVIDLQPL